MEREILNLINNSSNILIITHINPDGDTLGCASALKSFIGEKADILIQIEDNFNFAIRYNGAYINIYINDVNKYRSYLNYDTYENFSCVSNELNQSTINKGKS